jgi:hypothetical protein
MTAKRNVRGKNFKKKKHTSSYYNVIIVNAHLIKMGILKENGRSESKKSFI